MKLLEKRPIQLFTSKLQILVPEAFTSDEFVTYLLLQQRTVCIGNQFVEEIHERRDYLLK